MKAKIMQAVELDILVVVKAEWRWKGHGGAVEEVVVVVGREES